MILSYVVLFLCLSLLFFVSGYLIRFEHKASNYLFLTGSIVLLLTGLFLIASPLSFKGGETATVSGNTTVTVNDYSEVSGFDNTAFLLILILTGLWGIVTFTKALANKPLEEDD